MRHGVKLAGLVAALVAVSSLQVVAKAAHKTVRAAHRAYPHSRYTAEDHCGQRAYSISVGNPAFPDRFAHWPNRWND